MIYFDNAASSYPKPPSVNKAVYNWLLKNGANPGRSGHDMSIKASELIFNTRTEISKMFGVDEMENIAFVPNATYGLNMLIQGLLSSGDHVVITDLEHNSVLRPVYLMSKSGVKFDIAVVDLYDDSVTVNNILKLCCKSTKLVICTQCSNVCGKIMPIELIRNSLPSKIKLIVDGSQAAGIIPTDLSKTGIDYYCAPSHKGLLGPQGSGFVAILSEAPFPRIVGGTGSESFNLNQPSDMPDLLENGTLPTPCICGLLEGIKYIQKQGVSKIYAHKKFLTEYFYERLSFVKDAVKYIETERGNFIGAACFNVKGYTSEEIGEYLNKNQIYVRSGFHCAPLFHKKMNTEKTGMVRVSFGEFNTINEIDRLIKLLNNIKKV